MLYIKEDVTLPINEWIFDNVSDAMIFVDHDDQIVAANHHAEQMLNINEEANTYHVDDYIDRHGIMEHWEDEQLIWTKQQPVDLAIMKEEWIGDLTCYTLKDGWLKGKKDSLIYRLKHARKSPYEGVLMHDRGQLIDCDYAFASMLGYKRSEMIGMSIFSLVHHDDRESLANQMRQEQHDSPYQVRAYKKNGEPIYAEVLSEQLREGSNNIRVAIVRNITERIENEQQIEFMAYYDQLTNLPNRNYFQMAVKNEINHMEMKNQRFAVYFIDIDYFKHINDTLGYQVGDQLLKGCATRLKQLLSDDVFIARMVSDEFLLLQRHVTDDESIDNLAKQIIDKFRNPLNINGYDIYTTVSIGVSIYPDSATEPSELIENADSAMYVIKEEGRNEYQVFRHSLKEGVKEQMQLETELHKALQHQDFELFFQPQYDLKTNRITGFEALCRWFHDDLGVIPPDRFIPLAEKTGLILELGDWVIYEACRQNKLWQDQGMPKVKVSVNLSAKQFLRRQLVDRVRHILDETGLEPQYLEIEITETMAMSNERYIIDTLHQFEKLGVQVALDDFGTGYSSLQYLSQFPLNKIKIDRSFIQNQSKQNVAIVKSIIHLSHALNLKVIAEGVETEDDLKFLLTEQCDEVQGFYFSKPIPAQSVQGFIDV
ncbi:diguanylate cyclase (GGDEF)-like protein/PAS domain S-box-containing protein [Alkalibacillus flavidus]|uniref:Diguanylate cyclase (GGDEF)-like protein/PAS domain S-box-containing protein n=1 Tax=Alkalibacillus flavidus TaxID=546021 RepID=A0ABV2KQU8_9BACI